MAGIVWTGNPKVKTTPKVVENEGAGILDFKTVKMVMVNQPDVEVVDKEQRKSNVVDVPAPNDDNIRKKEH